MSESKIEVGTIVRHPRRPAWGPGKTLAVGGGGQVTVYFRDAEETNTGDAVKTLATGTVGLEIAEEQSEPMLDSLPPFSNGTFKGARKPRLSLDSAVQTYLDRKPGALGDGAARDTLRASNVGANRMWADRLGGGRGDALLDEGKTDDARQRLLEIAAAPGVLSPDESSALERALDDDDAAQAYLRALFAVTEQSTADQATFQPLIDAVVALPRHDEPGRVATWQVLTQFPGIACPEHHIQLKPATVQKCASRLNFDLRYTGVLNWWTYGRLLKLADILLARLKPHGAVDFFDVQPFMRVIAAV
ncbi:MAG TPA: hypothetical protein VLB51_00675 [Methylomirabilota bacterium]|nr:hypothetical protein [Methylomirabilota bacterium]